MTIASRLMLALLALPTIAQGATVAQRRDQRRVLIVAAPSTSDRQLLAQRQVLSAWRRGAADRDLDTVEIVGDRIDGADDAPAALRRRFALPDAAFAVVLIGKDGHVAMRSSLALSERRLRMAIDAMPMRRAGLR